MFKGEISMSLLPKEADRKPRETRFWVSKESGGLSSFITSESEGGIEERLSQEFPAYRLRRAGANVLRKVIGSGRNEI